jgi:DHA1 family multidrug resistance protein-like MFS transporter
LIALVVINFLMYCGFFLVIPLLAVQFVERLGFAAALVGLALAIRQLLQQGITLVGGVLADRFGARGLIGMGVLIRAVGFVFLAWADTPAALMLAMVLSALGGALFEAPSRAAIAALTLESERARVFALLGVVSGLGMAIGPLLGALLLRFNFQVVSLTAAGCFVLVALITLLLPPIQVAATGQPITRGLGLAVRDQPFLIFTALLMGYWFMWVQITLSIPLVAERMTGNSDSIGMVYALNAGMTIILQYPLMGLVERWLRPLPILIIGTALMALGLGSVALATSLPLLLVSIILFTFGTLLATPTQQTVTADLSNPQALGSYFGINALALAFGGGLGNLSGGLLTDAAQRVGIPALPWLVFALLGFGSAVGLALLNTHLTARPPVRVAQSES